jgi:Leucine-rich repeat (LRR) protein
MCLPFSSIPSTLGALTNLTYLRLSDNALNDTMPSTLGNLLRLRFLYLEKNRLSGSIVRPCPNVKGVRL